MNWQKIDYCIQEKSLLRHPFYQTWSMGALTLDDLRFYAKQYYALETTFPRLLSRIHANCEDPEIRQHILENLNDEEQGKENHRELWLRFSDSLGLSRDEVTQAPRHTKTTQCIDMLMNLAANANPAIGLAALYAYESQLPDISQSKIDGLRRFYGIDAPSAIQFFEVHQKTDVWHAEQEKTMLTQMQASTDDIYAAVETSCQALWTFLDGVEEAIQH